MEKIRIGIDVGGTTTKIVGFAEKNGKTEMLPPQFVKATDHLTSVYGAFGKFTVENKIALSDISDLYVTGAGSSVLENADIYGLSCKPVQEFRACGVGGLYLSHLNEAIVVSMGTGTALIHAKKVGEIYETEYLGGTGVGGGTIMGLCRKMAGLDDFAHIESLCEEGNLDNIDLRIKDFNINHSYHGIDENLTAANFGKLSDLATPADCTLGVVNMVGETIAMLSVFAARNYRVKDIVLTGNLSNLTAIRHLFENLADKFSVRFLIPENSQFGTVIGAPLSEEKRKN